MNLSRLKFLRNLNFWGHFLFWTWNAIFLMFMFFGFVPALLTDLIGAVRTGVVPLLFPISIVILTLIPLAVTLIGYRWLRNQPRKLLALGYGVEGPLMLLFIIRIFAFRQIPAAAVVILLLIVIGMAVLLWQLFDPHIDRRGKAASVLRLIGASLALLVGVYAAVWASLYAFPLLVAIVKAVAAFVLNFNDRISGFWNELRGVRLEGVAFVPLFILWGVLLAYTSTVLVGLPAALSVLYTRLWRRALRTASADLGRPLAYGLTVATAMAAFGIFAVANRQPQQNAFALLKNVPDTRAAAEALLDEQTTLRNGLLNAYLANVRYISAVGEVHHVKEMYVATFTWRPRWDYHVPTAQMERAERWSEPFVSFYNVIAQPVLYRPVGEHSVDENVWWRNATFEGESAEAAAHYQQFFDQPIMRAEREEIVRAARTTWNVQQATTNWQAVDDREILLTRQEITIVEDGDMADIELYEVYQNQTWDQQEVLYYFSLPESAVITGLWLGNSADKSEAFTHRVAPRGAAQAVYRNEVRRQVDPALLEQLGPRQYRLRAFPVPPKTWSDATPNRFGQDVTIEEGAHLHLWMTYRVIGNRELPQLAVKHNIYWDNSSVRLLNGAPMRVASDQWMPPGTPTPLVEQDVDSWRKVDFATGQTVLARPLVQFRDVPPPFPETWSLAVVLDRSRSMVAYERAVADAFSQLSNLNATIDVFATASEFHPEDAAVTLLADFDAEDVLYFGGQHAGELLAQYAQLKQREYDAVLVFTDSSGYEQGESPVPVPQPAAPVWMVHFGGFPIGYDDDTLQAIQASGGAATTDLSDGLTRLALALSGERASRDFVENYEWRTLPTDIANEWFPDAVVDPKLAPFAARRLILSAMADHRDALGELDILDQLHAIAVENSIVTPYSSMIVLVNERQNNLLDKLENADDRFEREFEEVDETQGVPITGVPEPHEYVLMALALGMLIWYRRQKRQASVAVAD